MWKYAAYSSVDRPNDGFLRQLELYHAMGCRVDLSFPAYRRFRLDLLTEQMQKGLCTNVYMLFAFTAWCCAVCTISISYIHISTISNILWFSLCLAPCGLRGGKNWPAPFPGWMSYKATKPGLVSVLYLSMCYMVLLFIRAPFYVLLVCIAMFAVFWLFWLSYQYLQSDWLERLLFCVSLGSWVISLTVLGASVTNSIEPPRASVG